MDEPDEEPTEKPTNTAREAQKEGEWMSRNWIAIASVSILSMLGLIAIMMLFTGLVEVPAPMIADATGQWVTIGVVGLVVLAVLSWGWRSVAASPK